MRIKKILCALLGHPRVVTNCFGYKYCARCEEQVGDSLGGYWSGEGIMIVGHDCEECEKSRNSLKWHERLLTKMEDSQ